MSIKLNIVAAAAALALPFAAHAASLGPAGQGTIDGSKAQSTLTLIMHGGGGGFGGGMHGGGFGPMHMGGMGPHFGPGGHFAGHPAFFHGGHPGFFHGRHGFFRHGRFIPFGFGVGFYGDYWGGGSCYWNCRTAGFGPGYCSAYSYNFCY